MDKKKKIFVQGLMFFTFVVVALHIFLFMVFLDKYLYKEVFFSLAFISIINIIFNILFYNIAREKKASFFNKFMLINFIKMFIYAFFLMIFLFFLQERDKKIVFAFNFLALYFIFTTFDIINFLKILKK